MLSAGRGAVFVNAISRIAAANSSARIHEMSGEACRGVMAPRTAKNWTYPIDAQRMFIAFSSYSIAVGLLPPLAWIGFSIRTKEVAAGDLDPRLPETVAEWLEPGRSIVCEELFDFAALVMSYPDHPDRLREMTVASEHAGSTGEKSDSISLQARSAAYPAEVSLQEQADGYCTLVIEHDNLRDPWPSFQRLLLHKEFSQLRTSVHSGL